AVRRSSWVALRVAGSMPAYTDLENAAICASSVPGVKPPRISRLYGTTEIVPCYIPFLRQLVIRYHSSSLRRLAHSAIHHSVRGASLCVMPPEAKKFPLFLARQEAWRCGRKALVADGRLSWERRRKGRYCRAILPSRI